MPVDAAPRPPALALFLTELPRGAAQTVGLPVAWPLLTRAPRDNPHGVLVLPGLMTTDTSTALLRRYLHSLGHTAWGWRLGRNRGPSRSVLEGVPRAVEVLAERTGGSVSVVGWSLGGIYAREVARARPELVRQVITLGSPFALRDPVQTRADSTYRKQRTRSSARARARGDERPPEERPWRDLVSPLPVASTAVFSRRDGVVHWTTCIAPPSPGHQNVEVRCSHLGFGADPATLWLLADRLAQDRPGAAPFTPPRLLRAWYPSRARASAFHGLGEPGGT